MASAFHAETGRWKIGWPGIVSRHDLVYLSPPDDPMSGIPLGNGDVGVLCWVEQSKIIMVLNKSDLWDDARFGRFTNWSIEENEYSTTLRHGGRISIDFHLPVFDPMYLKDFECRLSLADASMALRLNGPFGDVAFRAFVGDQDGVLCCEIENNLVEKPGTDIRVERYGSRMFHHWYSLVNPDSGLGLPGTQAFSDETGAYITHELTGGSFALGYSVVNRPGGIRYERESSHSCACSIKSGGGNTLQFMAGITSPISEDPLPLLKKRLAAAGQRGMDCLLESHRQAWKSFWDKSFIQSGDDFLDNIWYLTLYYANASQRGRYPGRFIGGLWNWNHDFQAWGFYFHWNQQQLYWPLNAAGHPELVESYLNMRFDGLEHARTDARELFGADGALVSDVSERRGYNSQLERENHTPGVQIALDFWRQYRYTQDVEFLKKRALPYMMEIARFFETRFIKGEDGLYHAHEGTGYEGGVLIDDVVSEIASAKAFFPAVLEGMEIAGAEDPHSARWRDIADHLPEFMTLLPGQNVIGKNGGEYVLNKGAFKGDSTGTSEMLAAGFGTKEQRTIASLVPREQINTNPDQNIYMRYDYCIHMFFRKLVRKNWELPTAFTPANLAAYEHFEPEMTGYPGIFPWVEFAAAFPSGVVGVAQKGTRAYRALVNTTKLYADIAIGWNPLPIVLARLGLSRELSAILKSLPDYIPMYANGTFADGMDHALAGPGAPLELQTQNVWSTADDWSHGFQTKRYPFLMAPFRHIGFEAPSIIACALNERLLQSHDGVIRVAPAADPDKQARFMLHAAGGFVVSAEIESGKPAWISVRSQSGRECRVENPWSVAYIYRNNKYERMAEESIIPFPTEKDDQIMLVPDQETVENWVTVPAEYQRNDREKRSGSGGGLLGLPRLFP